MVILKLRKSPILINSIYINRIVVSNKVFFSKNVFKYFIGYKDGNKVRLFYILLPKMSAYWRGFDETKYMYFFTNDDKLLETYNEILEKVSSSIKKGFDSDPVYNEKCLKAKIKSYEWEINTILTVTKHLNNVVNVFVYQYFWLILF